MFSHRVAAVSRCHCRPTMAVKYLSAIREMLPPKVRGATSIWGDHRDPSEVALPPVLHVPLLDVRVLHGGPVVGVRADEAVVLEQHHPGDPKRGRR